MADSLSVSQLHPVAGYVLVEPAKSQQQTASGIYLPENQDEKPQHGTVLAVGDDALVDGQKVASPVKKGDHVIYKKWGGNEFKVGDTEYQFLKFEDILATIK
ncbi:co-chaperone GroES [Patescibacteria group bacterium]|nr:co-chaperone GroES [Patescibacteria group bacterium]